MAKLPIEPGTPPWWGRAVDAMERAKADRPTQPTKLFRVAVTGDLRSAADFPGCMAYHEALGVPVWSDGVHWYPVTLGAHL